jgi:hypothetical protein
VCGNPEIESGNGTINKHIVKWHHPSLLRGLKIERGANYKKKQEKTKQGPPGRASEEELTI